MDFYFRKPDEFQLHFNCNFYSTDSIPLDERRRPVLGIFLIVTFVVFELLYLPCLLAMMSKQLRQNFCYKIMLMMAVYDMLLLFTNALFAGYALLHGYMPCDMPIFSFFIGLVMISLWIGYSTTSMILALNRCLAFSRFSGLFAGKMAETLWLLLPIFVTTLMFLFGRPGFFSSVQCAFFSSPHQDYYEDTEGFYPLKLYVVNNLTFSLALPTIYVIYFLMNYFMSKQRSSGMSKREYSLFIQVLVVNCTIAMAAFGYVMFQFLRVPKALVFLSHISWVLIEGVPPIVYLCVNKSIQRIILGTIKRGDGSKTARVSSVSQPTASNNNRQ